MEIVSDCQDVFQGLWPIACQNSTANRRERAILDQIAFGDVKDKVSRRRVDLSSSHSLYEKAMPRLPDDFAKTTVAREDKGVAHSRDGHMAIRLPAAVSRQR